MDKIRIMVATQPRLMREVVLEVISGQPDIEVVAEVQDDSKIIDLVGEMRPDWLDEVLAKRATLAATTAALLRAP